ncbi:MAG TPA: ATP-binding cassette domain-containing protein [Candidatus Paceibacterota bacterium]
MFQSEVILRFSEVSFGYSHNIRVLDAASFSVRRGAKIALMGQNGAGKSTIFSLIAGILKPDSGSVSLVPGVSIATAKQAISREEMKLTIREFFEGAFREKVYDIDPRIEKILKVVHLHAPLERAVGSFSGGQQARLLLVFALIQNADLLLLDEPTNNLDKAGIKHLRQFLIDYQKTCIVISHDADFLNSFTEGVIYLDIFTKKIEQYTGNYLDVVVEITRRIERERAKNARLEADIEHRKDQANFFAQKGGHMRDVARKMNEKIAKLEEDKVEARREDKTIRKFVIPVQKDISGEILRISSIPIIKNHKTIAKQIKVSLKRKEKLLISGPNGIGKTTFLNALANGTAKGVMIQSGIVIGYYRQDFSTLDPKETVYKSLIDVMKEGTHEALRSVAAGFLIHADLINSKIEALSEGQKGLVSFARLVLMRPGLLILDEPTNHINFRHIPIIAEALNSYDGAMILVSHVPDFVKQIKIDKQIDLEKLK